MLRGQQPERTHGLCVGAEGESSREALALILHRLETMQASIAGLEATALSNSAMLQQLVAAPNARDEAREQLWVPPKQWMAILAILACVLARSRRARRAVRGVPLSASLSVQGLAVGVLLGCHTVSALRSVPLLGPACGFDSPERAREAARRALVASSVVMGVQAVLKTHARLRGRQGGGGGLGGGGRPLGARAR